MMRTLPAALACVIFGAPAVVRAQGSWTPLDGPEDATVRAIAIAPSTPETIYAGTSGGVFKRAFGTRWTRANTGITDIDAQALAVDPSAPTTLYAATPSAVFKTTNGGGSWTPISTGLPAGGVLSLAIDAIATGTLYDRHR